MRVNTVQTAEELATAVQSFNQTTMDRLRAKYLPSSLEILEIESFIRNAETNLAAYDEGVQRLEQLREDTAKAIDNARALSASIRKLAPETLYQVFSYYVCDSFRDVEPYILVSPETKYPYPNVCLTSVCLFWRDLVLTQPSLWTKILISVHTLLRNPKYLDLIHHYLVQSGTLSLDILVANESRWPPIKENMVWIQKMFDTLIEYRLRWGRFTYLFDPHEEFDSYTLHSLPGDFPSLKYLHCGAGLPSSKLLYSSQLQSYRGAIIDFTTQHDYRPLSNLIELMVRTIKSCHTIKNVLRRMPLLEKFVLAHWRGSLGGPDADTTVYVSKISTMSVSLNALLGVDGWELVHFPCLRTLELAHFNPVSIIEEIYLLDFRRFSNTLCDAGAILHTVKLESIPNKEVVAFLALHPSISDLTLCMPYLHHASVFNALDISQKDDTNVLPNMRSLSITMDCFCDYDPKNPPKIEDAIYQIVDSRTTTSIYESKGVVRLETLALETRRLRSDAGKALYARLSDRLTIRSKETRYFSIETYQLWVGL